MAIVVHDEATKRRKKRRQPVRKQPQAQAEAQARRRSRRPGADARPAEARRRPHPEPPRRTPEQPAAPVGLERPGRHVARAALPEPLRHRASPSDALAALRAAGTPEAWLEAQLAPVARSPSRAKIAADRRAGSRDLRRTPAEKCADRPTAAKGGWEYGHDLGNWSILRRIYSERTRARDHGRLLVDRPAHPDRSRPRLGLPLRLRRHHPPARARARFEDLLTARARCTRRCASTSTTGSR